MKVLKRYKLIGYEILSKTLSSQGYPNSERRALIDLSVLSERSLGHIGKVTPYSFFKSNLATRRGFSQRQLFDETPISISYQRLK